MVCVAAEGFGQRSDTAGNRIFGWRHATRITEYCPSCASTGNKKLGPAPAPRIDIQFVGHDKIISISASAESAERDFARRAESNGAASRDSPILGRACESYPHADHARGIVPFLGEDKPQTCYLNSPRLSPRLYITAGRSLHNGLTRTSSDTIA